MNHGDERAGPISVRVLVVALVVQLLVGAAFVWAAATGFSFLEGGATVAAPPTPAPAPRAQPAGRPSDPACRRLAPSSGGDSAPSAPAPRPPACTPRP